MCQRSLALKIVAAFVVAAIEPLFRMRTTRGQVYHISGGNYKSLESTSLDRHCGPRRRFRSLKGSLVYRDVNLKENDLRIF